MTLLSNELENTKKNAFFSFLFFCHWNVTPNTKGLIIFFLSDAQASSNMNRPVPPHFYSSGVGLVITIPLFIVFHYFSFPSPIIPLNTIFPCWRHLFQDSVKKSHQDADACVEIDQDARRKTYKCPPLPISIPSPMISYTYFYDVTTPHEEKINKRNSYIKRFSSFIK